MALILVIDDSATVRDAAASLLGDAGYDVQVASSGESALESVRNHKPDLLLVDLSLRDTTGPALCERLRVEGGLGPVPVLFMATPGDPLEPLVRQSLPGVAVMQKPLRVMTLTSLIAQALVRRPEPLGTWLVGWAERIAAAPSAERHHLLNVCLEAAGLSQEVGLSGDLAVISATALFQMLALQGQSGMLRVECRDLELDVHLQAGFVDAVIARRVVPNLRLGRILVSHGFVGPDTVDRALASDLRPLGNALITLGELAKGQLEQALSFQSAELFYELIRQRSGRFTFSPTEAPLDTRLGLNAETLLLEGCRRADESSVLEARLRPASYVLASSWQAQDDADRELLRLCRAPRRVDELLVEAGVSRFATLQRLAKLVDGAQLTVLDSI